MHWCARLWCVFLSAQAVSVTDLACGLLAGCASSDSKLGTLLGHEAEGTAVTDAVSRADVSPRLPTQGESGRQADRQSQPFLFPGSDDPVVSPPVNRKTDERTASIEGVSLVNDGVEINFDGADVQAAAKSLLGDVLRLNYVVDPRVQAKITLASASPIPRKDVLPVFESVLRLSNVAIVREGSLMKIVPVADASTGGTVSFEAGQMGFGVSVVPLHYTSASTVARMVENFVSRQGAVKVDQSRNLLLVRGTTSERESAIDVIGAFDVEWLHNRSVGVYPLKSTAPDTIIRELEPIFETNDGGQGEGVVSFQPVARMNAVMAVSKSAKILEKVTQWVKRLDRSDSNGTTVRVYKVKYGSATQLAKILNNVFVSDRPISETPVAQITPGKNAVQSRLDSLGQGSSMGSGSSGMGSGSSPGTSNGSSAGNKAFAPIAAAFDSFAPKNGSAPGQNSPPGLSPTNNAAAVFQNVRITADESNNSLVIYSNQEDYHTIERALLEIDRVQVQVAIDATIAEVDLTDQLQFGIQHYLQSGNFASSLNSNPNATPVSSTGSTGSTAISAATLVSALQPALPGYNLLLGPLTQPQVVLSALSSVTNVKVLSAPSLLALDNQPAILQVGDEVPISTGTATILSNSNTPVVNTIEMRDTGVILKVLPHVHPNGTIDIEVEQEISNVNASQQQSLTPTISQRRVHSTISVPSGQTVLLGGLISERDEKDRSGIPGLDQIKFLGDLVSNTSTNKQRTELIIFIKPTLVRNSMDAHRVTQEFRERLSLMRPHSSVIEGEDVPSVRK